MSKGDDDSLQDHIDRWRTTVGAGSDYERAAAYQSQSMQGELKKMLKTAVQLEFATVPPYLCALWSIKDDLHPFAKSLREIVQEEMLHMGLMCNMLAAIGEPLRIHELAPTYPGKIPGDVHEGLVLSLQGLNKDSLKAFLQIESPVELASSVPYEIGDPTDTGSRTIGEFYQCVYAAFQEYEKQGGTFHAERQVSASLVWRVIGSVKDVKAAIGIITTQGEGATLKKGSGSSPRDSSRDDYAHYYRFLEMWKGKRLVRLETRFGKPERYEWKEGYKLPECRPMGPVPKEGFKNSSPYVQQLLYDFDRTYHEMLGLLENTWLPGGQGRLVKAIGKMFELERYAKPLMEIPRPDYPGHTYGPVFTPPQSKE